MAFTYAVPITTFDSVLRDVDRSLHSEFLERMRQEIHAHIARRMAGPDIGTITGQARTYFDSSIAHGDMLFYSPMSYEEATQKTGAPRETLSHFLFKKSGLGMDPQSMLLIRQRSWRYPGDGGGGLFAQAVNAVVAASKPIVNEYKKRSRELRDG
jgi:hypothetical protein